jgi:hypothetical protein
MVKLFCDICDEIILPSENHVTVDVHSHSIGIRESIEICEGCYESFIVPVFRQAGAPVDAEEEEQE